MSFDLLRMAQRELHQTQDIVLENVCVGVKEKEFGLRHKEVFRVGNNETPFFVFRKEQFKKLFIHFSKFGKIYYPVKANDHIEILREVDALGGCFEVDGLYHIEYLLSIGVSPEQIQFSIPIKKQNDVEKALEYGIKSFVIDTEEEYHKIAQKGKNIQFMIRISITDILHIQEISHSKWGMSLKKATTIANSIESDGNHFLGISFYLPKEIYNPENFTTVLDQISKNFKAKHLEVLDIGGGLDNSFSSNFKDELNKIKQLLNVGTIVVEPGRNLIDPCIDMVVSVIGISKRGRNMWAYIDAGIYSGLLDCIIKNKIFKMSILHKSGSPFSKTYKYAISGPTSDSLDFLGEYTFNAPLDVDDRLIIHNCGAYTYVLNTDFCGAKHFGFEVI